MFFHQIYLFSTLFISIQIVQSLILFPPTFVLQLTCCIAVPSDLPNRNFALNLCMQSNYMAPSNVSQLTPTIIQAKSNDYDLDRRTLYSYITNILNDYIFTGEECLKRLICETAASTIITTHRNSLLEKVLLHIVTPSRDIFSLNDTDMREYHEAEMNGKLKGNCVSQYKECEFSILDFLTTKIINK